METTIQLLWQWRELLKGVAALSDKSFRWKIEVTETETLGSVLIYVPAETPKNPQFLPIIAAKVQ